MKPRLRDYRGVARPVGFVVTWLGVAIGACALAGMFFERMAGPGETARSGGEIALAISAAAAVLAGAAMHWYGGRYALDVITRRHATLAVAAIWFAAGVFGALPFILGAEMSPHDAFFEAVSGLTTTGATVIDDIEVRLSRLLLLWRSLIEWLGGMGIVVLFVAVFPNLGSGGKHMFGEEVPGTSAEALRPRIAETSRVLWQLYSVFTLSAILVMRGLGMSWFEAVCHGLTCLSTGGFSTRDASIAAFDSAALELAIAGFMILASVNYSLFYAALRGRSVRVFLRSTELKVFLLIVFAATWVITFGILDIHGNDLFEAFRYASFTVATFISSTGYGTDDYMAYPAPVLFAVILMMLVGGCAGSTAGGLKVERVVVMAKLSWIQIRKSFRPSMVQVVRMGDNVVQQAAMTENAVFFMTYIGCGVMGIAAVTLIDAVPVQTAFGAVVSCLSNMGPAPYHLGPDNFVAYSAVTKVMLAFGMLLGRLEFFTLLSLLVPGFWRR